MSGSATVPNPDLALGRNGRPGWNQPETRRASFHALPGRVRYGVSMRAPHVWQLQRDMHSGIAARADVQALTPLPWFSAMIVLRDDRILFERYAPDFQPGQAHSIMSISKTTMNLIVGRLVAEGRIDLGQPVRGYLPWIGEGYASASVQQVMNMDVANDYTEDYADPRSRCFDHEAATGYRLPADGAEEGTMRSFIASIDLAPDASSCQNLLGHADYKSANTDVLAFIAEAASGRTVTSHLIEIAEAAGIEGTMYVATDRVGFPCCDGGICLSARDVARYGMIFARGGRGVRGERIGDPGFIANTLSGGLPMPAPRDSLRYSNQTNTSGRWLGHGGYGGQYMVVDPGSRTAGVFLSVLESVSGYEPEYYVPIIRMLDEVTALA